MGLPGTRLWQLLHVVTLVQLLILYLECHQFIHYPFIDSNVLWIGCFRKKYTQHNKQCLIYVFSYILFSLSNAYNNYDTLQGFTDAQMQQVQENTVLVAEREKEIAVILQSIREIHQFFQDIAMLVVEQGTVLDRIDYNIEHAAVRVTEGRQQLEKVCGSMYVLYVYTPQYTHGPTSSTHTHIHIDIHIRTFIRTGRVTKRELCVVHTIAAYACVCITYTCIYKCIHKCIHKCIYKCVYKCIYKCIHS